MLLKNLSRQLTLLGEAAQARIDDATVAVPMGLNGASYTQRYLVGAGVSNVSFVDMAAPAGPAFMDLLDARSQGLLRGSHFALRVLRELVQERPPTPLVPENPPPPPSAST